MVIEFLNVIGRAFIHGCEIAGNFLLFFVHAITTLFTTKPKVSKILRQMENVGVDSLTIVMLTGTFAGAVLAFQSYIGFKRFGAIEFLGPVVALSLTRELGPVLTGLMVTGRAGSAMTAEIGTMNITEQIDALRTLCINVHQYLIVPRMLASTIILPFLSLFSSILGIAGGYFIAVYVLNLNGEQYLAGIRRYLEFTDIFNGLLKSCVFGLLLSWVGAYKGFYARGGARGVGKATTESVVVASILILAANYFLTSMLF